MQWDRWLEAGNDEIDDVAGLATLHRHYHVYAQSGDASILIGVGLADIHFQRPPRGGDTEKWVITRWDDHIDPPRAKTRSRTSPSAPAASRPCDESYPPPRDRGPAGHSDPQLALPGCWNPFNPLESTQTAFTEPAPVPDTPTELMNLFEWCWEHRDPYRYAEIFTEDFQYVFAVADTEGNSQPDRSYNRTDEIDSARHLFIGGKVGVEPARRITLDFDSDILPLPDNRPNKSATTHREILIGVVLTIETDAENFRIKSIVRFFVVRGDEALIHDLGFLPDSSAGTSSAGRTKHPRLRPGRGEPRGARRAPRGAERGVPARALDRGLRRASGGCRPRRRGDLGLHQTPLPLIDLAAARPGGAPQRVGVRSGPRWRAASGRLYCGRFEPQVARIARPAPLPRRDEWLRKAPTPRKS